MGKTGFTPTKEPVYEVAEDLCGYMTAEYRGKKFGIDAHHLFSPTLWSLPGGLLGAKVRYWLTDIPVIIANPSILLNLSDGFVVYGGIIGGVATGFLLCKKKKLPFAENIDLVIPYSAGRFVFQQISKPKRA